MSAEGESRGVSMAQWRLTPFGHWLQPLFFFPVARRNFCPSFLENLHSDEAVLTCCMLNKHNTKTVEPLYLFENVLFVSRIAFGVTSPFFGIVSDCSGVGSFSGLAVDSDRVSFFCCTKAKLCALRHNMTLEDQQRQLIVQTDLLVSG